jgi:Kef-type K+ transport system membrane component KefB
MELELAVELFLCLAFAKLGEEVAKRAGHAGMVGILVSGMILGSIYTHVFHRSLSESIHAFAVVGIWLLLFSAGLEIHLKELFKIGLASFAVASAGVVVPLVLGLGLGMGFHFGLQTSLFIGATLTATSVGISVEIVRELELLRDRFGVLIIGSAVIDDVLGILILSILVGLREGLAFGSEARTFAVIAVFMVLSLTAGTRIAKAIERWSTERTRARALESGAVRFQERSPLLRMSEPMLTVGLLTMLVFAILAELSGLAMITGTFLAGLIIGETRAVHDLSRKVLLLGSAVFVPLFFVTTGMTFDVAAFGSVGIFVLLYLVAAVVSKLVGCGIAARFFGFNPVQVGLAMMPRAEIALVIASIGLKQGLIDVDIFSSVVVMAMVTGFVPPILLKRSLVAGRAAAMKIGETEGSVDDRGDSR